MPPDTKQRTAAIFLAALLILLLIWRSFLWDSFWLDETISRWMVSGSLADAWFRALQHQGQSPLYFVLLWGWVQAFGSTELMLRMPSVIVCLASVGIFYSWLRDEFGERSALAGALLMLSFDRILFSWCARPYAFALLGSLFALREMRRFALGGELRHGRLACFSALSTFYFHYLFGLVALPLVLLAGKRAWQIRGVVTLSVLAALPGFFHLLGLSQRSQQINFTGELRVLDFLKASFPPATLLIYFAALAAGVLLSGSGFRLSGSGAQKSSALAPAWVWAWALLPGLVLGFGAVLGVIPFADRYVLWALPGLAFIGVNFIAHALDQKAQRSVVLLMFCFTITQALDRRWMIEDWRGAFEEVRALPQCKGASASMLIYSGLAEIEDPSLRANPALHDYLSAPASVYLPGFEALPIALGSSGDELRSAAVRRPCALVALLRKPSRKPSEGVPPTPEVQETSVAALAALLNPYLKLSGEPLGRHGQVQAFAVAD